MPAIELWLFSITDPLTGKRRRTAFPLPWSREVREVHEQAVGHGQTIGPRASAVRPGVK